jgi:hypothetical protein
LASSIFLHTSLARSPTAAGSPSRATMLDMAASNPSTASALLEIAASDPSTPSPGECEPGTSRSAIPAAALDSSTPCDGWGEPGPSRSPLLEISGKYKLYSVSASAARTSASVLVSIGCQRAAETVGRRRLPAAALAFPFRGISVKLRRPITIVLVAVDCW